MLFNSSQKIKHGLVKSLRLLYVNQMTRVWNNHFFCPNDARFYPVCMFVYIGDVSLTNNDECLRNKMINFGLFVSVGNRSVL